MRPGDQARAIHLLHALGPATRDPAQSLERFAQVTKDKASANGQSTCLGTHRPGFDSR
jgi:hypothetical protein